MQIQKITYEDIKDVLQIYKQGIQTGIATFQRRVPSVDQWDMEHLRIGRLKAVDEDGRMLGWVALSAASSRCAYKGVAEVSIYIAEDARKNGVGETLLKAVIEESEAKGIWTLQSGIFEINHGSIALHNKCGFRKIGYRERVSRDCNGVWQNVVLMERRSDCPQFN